MSIPGSASPLFFQTAAAAAAADVATKSLRFNSGDSAHLSKTFSSAGNRQTWTWSGWVKRTAFGAFVKLFGNEDSSEYNGTVIQMSSTGLLAVYDITGSVQWIKTASQVFKDPSAWYHIVVAVDTTDGTAEDRVKVYVNGSRITSFSSSTNPSQNANTQLNDTTVHGIGKSGAHDGSYFDGYMAEINFVDGVSGLTASDFGEYDDNNVWQPKAYSGTYGTNGFHLDFSDNSSNAALGDDSSGNNNDWTVNNLTANTSGTNYTNISTLAALSGSTLDSSYNDVSKVFDGSGTGVRTVAEVSNQGEKLSITFSPAITLSSETVSIDTSSTYQGMFVTVDGSDGSRVSGSDSNTTTLTTGSLSGSLSKITVDNGIDTSGRPASVLRIRIGGTELRDPGDAKDVDSMFDAPTNGSQSDTGAGGEVSGNYATLNPLHKGSSVVLANGNLNATASSGTSGVGSTIGMSSGKFFCEVTVNNVGDETKIGIGKEDALKSEAGSTATTWAYINIGDKMNSNINTSYGSSFTTGDVVGIAFDADGGNLYFYKNGVAQNSGTAAYTGLTSGPYFFHVTARYISTANDLSLNFGQRAFAYSAPSGYKALCTANLSDPTIADGSTAMDVVTYTGNGTTRSITSLSFSPDWLWFKTRNTSRENYVYDILRGVQRPIYPDLSNQAETGPDTDAVSSFDSNGWTMGGDPGGNNNNDTYVCWTWDAGSSTVSNTDGSITANVRANASAGFSIIQFLGNATSGATVGHGLNAAPELVIGKNRGGGDAWWVWFKAISSNASAFLKLGTTGLKTSTQYIANNTAPSSTVITLGSDYGWNSNQSPGSILYAFTPVSGYSAFGEYTGATDLFIYTGFKPQWLMLKSYAGDGFNWVIIDDARGADSSNVSNKLYPNLSGAEDSDARGTETKVVFLSNGFLFLDSGAETNSSSRSYVYAAFASHPINTSRGGFQNIP